MKLTLNHKCILDSSAFSRGMLIEGGFSVVHVFLYVHVCTYIHVCTCISVFSVVYVFLKILLRRGFAQKQKKSKFFHQAEAEESARKKYF